MKMRPRFGLLLLGCLVAGLAQAVGELGELAAARAKHPECFRPGAVSIVECGGEDWYVWCGDAEKCLEAETEEELYAEAVAQARMVLYRHFAKDDPSVKVEVSGARRMYQFAEGAFRCVVMGAPRKSVVVTAGRPTRGVNEAAGCTAEPAAEQSPVSDAEKPTERGPGDATDDMPDEEKLEILRGRLASSPDDYRIRVRMARIFAAQGKFFRALNNYHDAASMLLSGRDEMDADRLDSLLEIAKFEEQHGECARALKWFRLVVKLGDRNQVKCANEHISTLLIRQ